MHVFSHEPGTDSLQVVNAVADCNDRYIQQHFVWFPALINIYVLATVEAFVIQVTFDSPHSFTVTFHS
jgi:hypothetical protein